MFSKAAEQLVAWRRQLYASRGGRSWYRYDAVLRRLIVPVLAGGLGLYILLHTPARRALANLFGVGTRDCYFVCSATIAASQVVSALAALLLVIAAVLAALFVLERWDGAGYERPLVFGLIALAFVVVPAAALGGVGGWLDAPLLRSPLGPALAALPALITIGVALQRGWRPSRPGVRLANISPLLGIVAGAALSLLVMSIAVSLLHPPTGYDALSYHAPLAVYFWRDGNIDALLQRAPDAWVLAHPGTAEIWFGLLLIAGGEAAADLGQLPFALLGALAVHAFARRLGVRRGGAWLAAFAFLTAPIVVTQAGRQWNDIASAALLMVAVALASAPLAQWSSIRLTLLGLCLGLTATTKLALLPGVAAVGMFVVVVLVWQARRPMLRGAAARRLALLAFAFCVVAAPWWARNIARFGNPIYPAALPLIGRGYVVGDFTKKDARFVPAPAAWPLYPLFEPHSEESGMGALFAVGAIPGAVYGMLRRRKHPIALYLLVIGVTLPAWWALTQHEPRFLVAIFGLGFAFLPWSLMAIARSQRRRGAVVLAAAAIFSALVTLDQVLLPAASLPSDRWQFYDQVWAIDPAVASLPESEGILFQQGYAPLSYAGDYPMLGRSHSRPLIVVDAGTSIDLIVARMRQAGIRYVYAPAAPDSQPIVEGLYDQARFVLVRVSVVADGVARGTQRYLYRLK